MQRLYTVRSLINVECTLIKFPKEILPAPSYQRPVRLLFFFILRAKNIFIILKILESKEILQNYQ